MLTQQTLEKLRQMRLSAMAEAFRVQANDPDCQQLSFEERLGLLVDREWTARRDRRLARLLKQAHLHLAAAPEEIDQRTPRGLDKPLLRSLLACDWLRDGRNLLLTGPTGVGKTFIACAIGNAACRQGFRVRYCRLPRLLGDLELAKGDGSYASFLAGLGRTDLLILDDWGLAPLTAPEARDLLELIDERSQLRSTLVASQLPLENWHAALADPTVADAILDRLVHNAYKIALKGESMRKVIPGPASNEQSV
ncbi:MAG: IS21-like element helper ATPase IstB [Chitinophagales bacterium]